MTVRNSQTYDQLLLLKDAGAVTATGAGTVAGAARVLDLGPAIMNAKVIVDTSAINTAGGAGGPETYRVALQASNDPTFATGVVELGSTTVSAVGRAELHFVNFRADVTYRYVRELHTLGGTAPSINFTAFVGKH